MDREPESGFLAFEVTASASGYFEPSGACRNVGYTCRIGLETKSGPSDSVHEVASLAVTYPTPSITHRLQDSLNLAEIKAVRSFVTGSNRLVDFSKWVPV